MKVSFKLLGSLLGSFVLLTVGLQIVNSQRAERSDRVDFTYTSPHQRFGGVMAGHERNKVAQLGVEEIHLGWNVDHYAYTYEAPDFPLGAMMIVHFPPFEFDYDFYVENLVPAIERNPGIMWAIGNETDRPGQFQNAQFPADYAEIYHQLYGLIKQTDPTALVTISGVVQPTALRLQYLDMVWDAYLDLYGETIPVDFWNIHNLILREGASGWGAGIPPGVDAQIGLNIPIDQHDDMDIFREHVVGFRQWMADKGERNKALVISEMGILMPRDFGFEAERVKAFMYATSDYMLSAESETLGFPADGNRLVQQWAWFSLDDYRYDQFEPNVGFNGNLFDALTRQLTVDGRAFGDYLDPDLFVSSISAPIKAAVGETISVTVWIDNGGRSPANDVSVRVWQGTSSAGELLGDVVLDGELLPNAYADNSRTVEVPLLVTTYGDYALYVEVDVAGEVKESDEGNNSAETTLVISPVQIYLPTIVR